jgi:glycosyltransferase involved in cell wall biosynthesis
MRIGMMVDMYKPHISGVTNYVSLNKRVLEGWGHKVFVFTFGDQDYEDDELYVIRSPGVPLNVHETGFHLSFRYSLAAQRKARSMDVVHAHHPFLTGPLALRYCKTRGIPVVFTNHTRYDLYAQHYLPDFVPDVVGTTFLKAYLPNFCQQCDLVIAPSAGVMEVMRQLGVTSPIKVIPNGIELTPFQNPPRRFSRAELGLPEDAVVLLYVGRLSPEKNLIFLLRAFFGVASARPGVVLALVGDGPEKDNLRDQAEQAGFADRVKFFGKVEYAHVPGYLTCADVFVTASQTEVHPFSLIEAMAAGLAPLGIKSPGIGDTLVDDATGFLTAPDLAAFTAKLMRLVMEPDTRRRLAENAREAAKAYDIQRTAREVLVEYERLVAESVQRMRGWPGVRQRMRNLFSS